MKKKSFKCLFIITIYFTVLFCIFLFMPVENRNKILNTIFLLNLFEIIVILIVAFILDSIFNKILICCSRKINKEKIYKTYILFKKYELESDYLDYLKKESNTLNNKNRTLIKDEINDYYTLLCELNSGEYIIDRTISSHDLLMSIFSFLISLKIITETNPNIDLNFFYLLIGALSIFLFIEFVYEFLFNSYTKRIQYRYNILIKLYDQRKNEFNDLKLRRRIKANK